MHSERGPVRLRTGFTLIEVLVCTAVIALLVAVLAPSLQRARLRAKVVTAHSDLRQITTALDAYSLSHKDTLPPTYTSCMDKEVTFALPAELQRGKYLPRKSKDMDLTGYPDVFDGRRTYKYRAPERSIMNGLLTRSYSQIWVPDDFPRGADEQGGWFPRCGDPKQNYGGRVDRCTSILWGPVRYAVWSMGPDSQASSFPQSDGVVSESRFPLISAYWLKPESRAGVITHFQDRKGKALMSP